MNDEAIMRYATAKGYIQSCKMIFLSEHYRDKNIISTALAMHMLAAFALELYLKTWLLKAGFSSKDVKNYGHDIGKLYQDAKMKGLPEVAKLQELQEHFAGPHSDFTYRYLLSSDEIINTNWMLAFKVFDDLDFDVDTFVGASVSRGLEPSR